MYDIEEFIDGLNSDKEKKYMNRRLESVVELLDTLEFDSTGFEMVEYKNPYLFKMQREDGSVKVNVFVEGNRSLITFSDSDYKIFFNFTTRRYSIKE